jgi:hypothetical protein
MSDSIQARAEARLKAALAGGTFQDPRDFYRERLRALKERDPGAFEQATRYYREVLLPRVADEANDPLAQWMEYGRLLGELGGPGRTVEIDRSGRARPYAPPVEPGHLVLYLPDDLASPVLVVALPCELSPAQQATYDLLVRGRTSLL